VGKLGTLALIRKISKLYYKRRPEFLRRYIVEIVDACKERSHRFVIGVGALIVSVPTAGWFGYHVEKRLVEVLEHFEHWSEVVVVALCVFGFILSRLLLKHPNDTWNGPLSPTICKTVSQQMARREENNATRSYTKFADSSNLDELLDLNYRGFKNSAFEIELEQLKTRNAAFIGKNKLSFQLVFDPCKSTPVTMGYSCMLPLTDGGTEIYLAGKLKDADIPSDCVCGTKDRPGSVLLFAIMVKEEYRFGHNGFSCSGLRYFLECVSRHLRALYPQLADSGEYPSIYVQTEQRKFRKILKQFGFVSSGKKSGDGFEILVLHKPFPTANESQPQPLSTPREPAAEGHGPAETVPPRPPSRAQEISVYE
jgi:hypothetical protein